MAIPMTSQKAEKTLAEQIEEAKKEGFSIGAAYIQKKAAEILQAKHDRETMSKHISSRDCDIVRAVIRECREEILLMEPDK